LCLTLLSPQYKKQKQAKQRIRHFLPVFTFLY
jgi:hypothetical protein